MTQKISFLEETLEQFDKKEIGYNNEVKSVREELMANLKENNQKYEEKICNKDREISILNDRLNEMEEEVISKEEKIEEMTDNSARQARRWKDIEESLNSNIMSLQKDLDD